LNDAVSVKERILQLSILQNSQAKPIDQQMGNLPQKRLTPNIPPFTYTTWSNQGHNSQQTRKTMDCLKLRQKEALHTFLEEIEFLINSRPL
jgi:hypothetical protein